MSLDSYGSVIVDFDGVIASYPEEVRGLDDFKYENLVPVPGAVEGMKWLSRHFWNVIIWTARPEEERKSLELWLFGHDIPYRKLVMDKPWGLFFIDDRAVAFRGWKSLRAMPLGEVLK